MQAELDGIRVAGRDPGEQERAANLERGIAAAEAEITDLEAREEVLRRAAGDPSRAIPIGDFGGSEPARVTSHSHRTVSGNAREQSRQDALRALAARSGRDRRTKW